ncbi:hypothetical protein BC643_4386 [Mangrovibacterium diazotrophicum]|uniref:Uncharacterized protein n=1 Tax=Mangrovibacterium diazotrophicum TaxID=1261403 RepID=A0A419VV86_9BACT|nr:hypothetical protein BC643_4386 [Mangrovibacterium diazotrophicum]
MSIYQEIEYMDSELLYIAEIFAEEIRKGEWNDILDDSIPISRNKHIIRELAQRSPGFGSQEYRKAISVGMQNTR